MMSTDPMSNGQDPLGELIAQSGPRAQAPASVEAQIRAAAHEAWQQGVRRDRQQRRLRWASAAAVVALAFAGWAWLMNAHAPATAPALIASLAHSEGEVLINDEIPRDRSLQSPLYSGDEVRTGANSGARLSLNNAVSIRLAGQTRVQWRSADELELLAGAIYVDSGPRHAPLAIATPHGVVSHLGTRYQVRADAQSLQIGVREGEVQVSTAQGRATAQAQQQIKVDARGITRSAFDPYGEEWAWVDALAPRFAIDKRTLAEFLDWAAAETGYRLEYRDAGVQAAAAQTELSGQSESFTPAQALAAVLPTTDFTVRYADGRMIVERP